MSPVPVAVPNPTEAPAKVEEHHHKEHTSTKKKLQWVTTIGKYIVTPILVAAVGGYFSYRSSKVEAEAGYKTMVSAFDEMRNVVKEMNERSLKQEGRIETLEKMLLANNAPKSGKPIQYMDPLKVSPDKTAAAKPDAYAAMTKVASETIAELPVTIVKVTEAKDGTKTVTEMPSPAPVMAAPPPPAKNDLFQKPLPESLDKAVQMQAAMK